MATTKSRTTTSRARRTPASSRSAKPRAAKADTSLLARTGRTLKERPYTSAAIATGAVAAVAAAAAGAYFFSRGDKRLSETDSDVGTRVKDGLTEVGIKARGLTQRAKKSVGFETERTQAEIAEEALSLKQTGQSDAAVDELSGERIKAGAVAY